MSKIDEDVFDSVSNQANLQTAKAENIVKIVNTDIQNVLVYDVPKSWLSSIKKNRMTASAYLKQALREKLQRDDMLPSQY